MSGTRVYKAPEQIPDTDWIKGERVLLRPVTHADTEMIIKWRNAPEVRDHFVFRDTITAEMHEKWLEEKVETGKVVQWVMMEGSSGIGSVYLRDIDTEKKTAEYGIFIGEEGARGKGYAIEAARLVLRYAFEVLYLQTVGLRVYKDNERARKGYAAAGFREMRTLPAVESTDGQRADMMWMEAEPGIC